MIAVSGFFVLAGLAILVYIIYRIRKNRRNQSDPYEAIFLEENTDVGKSGTARRLTVGNMYVNSSWSNTTSMQRSIALPESAENQSKL